MEKFIYVVWNNIIGNNKECVYVRATENEIEEREFYNGFRHFNRDCYANSKEFPYGAKIDGRQILLIRKFDMWLEKNILNYHFLTQKICIVQKIFVPLHYNNKTNNKKFNN